MSRIALGALSLLVLAACSPLDKGLLERGLRLDRAVVRPCAAFALRGEQARGWPLASPFYRPQKRRDGQLYAWAQGGRVELSMFLAPPPRPRRLVLTSRALDRQEVRASINGVDLGARKQNKGWRRSSWELPAEAVRAGLNVVVLEAPVTERGSRRLAIAVDRLRIEPDASECDGGGRVAEAGAEEAGAEEAGVGVPGAGTPLELAPGTVMTAPLLVPPAGRLELRLAGEPGGALDLLVLSGAERLPAGSVAVPAAGAGAAAVALPGCCGAGRTLVLAAQGPGPVRLEELALVSDASAVAWRRACGVLLPQVLLVGGLAALFVLSAWRRWRLPWERWAPWVDLLLIVGVALLVRHLYLGEYPHRQAGLFPDAWEYLRRARFLASGESSLLGDTNWHAWQSWLRPPGYYFFLAQLFELGVGNAAFIARIQTLMWVATSAAVYGLGRSAFGRGAALFAGLAFALSLEAISLAAVVASEALFLLLLVPALALLTRVARRPTTGAALAAGLLFGLAVLVRSAPMVLVPAAALAIACGYGLRRSLGPMVALVFGMLVFVAPWCVRNSILAGHPMGVDTMAIPNLLASHPDTLYIDPGELDLETDRGWRTYYYRIKRAGPALEGKPVTKRGLVRLLTNPVYTLRSVTGRGLKSFFHPFTRHSLDKTGERRTCRALLLADLMNWQLFTVVVLALGAMAMRLRERTTWPLILWFLLILGTGTVLFPRADLPRYRFSTMPVLLVFAGWAVVEIHRRLGDALARRGQGSA